MLTRGIVLDTEPAYRVGARVRVREQRGCTAMYGKARKEETPRCNRTIPEQVGNIFPSSSGWMLMTAGHPLIGLPLGNGNAL